MKDPNNIISNIAITILIIGIFFSLSNKYVNMTYCCVLGTILLLIYVILLKKNNIKINKIFIMLFSVSIVFFISSFVFYSKSGFKYSMYFFIGTMLYLAGSNLPEKKTYIIKCLKLFSGIFAIITIVSTVLGDKFYYIYGLLFEAKRYYEVVGLAQYNCFSGIAGQTGLNAFFISIGLLITYIDIFTTKNKITKNTIMIIIYMIALMLTAKRAILLYNIIIMVLIIFYKNRNNLLKMIKYMSIVFISGIIIFFTIYNVMPKAFYVIERFFNQKDISTGRFDLYAEAWDIFEENSFYGIGINNFSDYLEQKKGTSIQVHNVPLQLLTELGVFQAIYVLSIISYIFLISIIDAKKNKKIEMYYGIAIQILFLMYFVTGNAIYDVPILYTYIISLILTNARKGEKNEKNFNINIS